MEYILVLAFSFFTPCVVYVMQYYRSRDIMQVLYVNKYSACNYIQYKPIIQYENKNLETAHARTPREAPINTRGYYKRKDEQRRNSPEIRYNTSGHHLFEEEIWNTNRTNLKAYKLR